MDDAQSYYFARNRVEYDWLAVTGACLMVDRAKFYEVGGFDEGFPVAYNDIDLCFKLAEAGYYNVCRNDVILYHYESVSRGLDNQDDEKMLRLAMERSKLYKNHPAFEGYDPSIIAIWGYNISFSIQMQGLAIMSRCRQRAAWKILSLILIQSLSILWRALIVWNI